MTRREPLVKLNDLQVGDLVLIKNYERTKMDLHATGPALFLEFVDQHRTSAIVYNLNTRRTTRVKISHLSPVRIC